MEKPDVIIAARRDYDDKHNIQIHQVSETEDSTKEFPMIYVVVSYKDEVRNLAVLNEVFPKGESPYQDEITHTPYIVIENRVYYIDDFNSFDMDTQDTTIVKTTDSDKPVDGVVYAD